MNLFKSLIVVVFFVSSISFAQETLPVYSDYLSDNVFLVHPAAAGIGNCGKLRVTARTQWAGVDEAPSLQTASYHNRLNSRNDENNIGLGVVLFNDRNGWHSQTGVSATFAYHIDMWRRHEKGSQLSFAISGLLLESRIDETNFQIQDPTLSYINQSKIYLNTDASIAYHYGGFFTYLTAKNLLPTPRNLYRDNVELTNIRRYLTTIGYYFENKNSNGISFEPSILAQLVDTTGEQFIDFNVKAYKNMANAQLWAALSYRQGFDGIKNELRYFTPVLGVNYKKYMFSYTYTKQSSDVLFDQAGYHQITLGINFGCREPRALGYPPNLNGLF